MLTRIILFASICWVVLTAPAAGLNWNTNQNRVTADMKSAPLSSVLQQVAGATGWKVYVEPDTTQTISARFKDLQPGDALPLLLGKLNFALVPSTNGAGRLLVFRTAAARATELVQPDNDTKPSRRIGNELIVRLKPGARIEDIAKSVSARVKGRIDGLNAYRLEFDSEEAAAEARDSLESGDEVAGVDENFRIDRPTVPSAVQAGAVPPPPKLQIKAPSEDGRVVVGLIDTAVQPLGHGLDAFVQKQISVAGNPVSDPNSPSHGTSMAETMLRSIQAATDGKTAVQILPVDVYGANPSTSTFDVASGIVQAVNGGARILNLSLGSDADSQFLRDVIAEVSKKNVAIFAAAGNEPVTTPFYPAAYPGVTAVTAVEQGKLAPYASRGSFVSVGAPGTSVIYFNDQPYYIVGTSAAAAFTSGLAAGYMDSTGNGIDKMRTFITNNFGLRIGP